VVVIYGASVFYPSYSTAVSYAFFADRRRHVPAPQTVAHERLSIKTIEISRSERHNASRRHYERAVKAARTRRTCLRQSSFLCLKNCGGDLPACARSDAVRRSPAAVSPVQLFACSPDLAQRGHRKRPREYVAPRGLVFYCITEGINSGVARSYSVVGYCRSHRTGSLASAGIMGVENVCINGETGLRCKSLRM